MRSVDCKISPELFRNSIRFPQQIQRNFHTDPVSVIWNSGSQNPDLFILFQLCGVPARYAGIGQIRQNHDLENSGSVIAASKTVRKWTEIQKQFHGRTKHPRETFRQTRIGITDLQQNMQFRSGYRKTRFGGKLFFAAPYIRVVERQHFRWTPDLALLRRIDTEFRNMIHGILIRDSEISITFSGIHDRFGFESRHLQKLSALRQWDAECDVPFFAVRSCRTKEVNASMTL